LPWSFFFPPLLSSNYYCFGHSFSFPLLSSNCYCVGFFFFFLSLSLNSIIVYLGFFFFPPFFPLFELLLPWSFFFSPFLEFELLFHWFFPPFPLFELKLLLPWSFSLSSLRARGWTLIALVFFIILSLSSNYYCLVSFLSPQAQAIATIVLISLLKLKLLLPQSILLCSNSSYYYLGPSLYPLLEVELECLPTLVLFSFFSLNSSYFLPWSFFLSLLKFKFKLLFNLVLRSLSLNYCLL